MLERTYYLSGRLKALDSLGLKSAAEKDKDTNLGFGAAGAGLGASIAGGVGSLAALKKYEQEDKLRHHADTAAHDLGLADTPEAYSKKLIDQHSTNYKPVPIAWDPMDPTGPHFRFSDHGINADLAKPSTLAHELGHVQLRESMPRLGKAINFARQARSFGQPIALLSGAFAPGENHPGYVAGASALSSVPTLVDEAYATTKALKNLRSSGYQGNALRVLAPAFGTYAAKAVADVGGDVFNYELGRGLRHLYGKATGDD